MILGGDDGEPSSSPSKKFKPPSRVPLYWQWEDKRVWVACASDLTKAINDSLDGDGQDVKFEAGGKMLEVKLDKMVQRNCSTGWERRIRCCLQDGNQCKFLPIHINLLSDLTKNPCILLRQRKKESSLISA